MSASAPDMKEVERLLGYARSSCYRLLDRTDRSDGLYGLAKSAGVHGVYLFNATPRIRRPAVLLASAGSSEEARAIHKRLWNTGRVPYLIVVLPHEVRAYSGFRFDHGDDHTGRFEIEDIHDLLADFSADAIDSGSIWQRRPISSKDRVDRRLLESLHQLGALLQQQGLSVRTANRLIGKTIFLRYLRDRGILEALDLEAEGISLERAMGREATTVGLERLIAYLNKRFNGRIFPIDFEREGVRDGHVASVAQILMGDVLHGEESQLHLDFEAYDFSYIAIETLSSIYERFLRSEDHNVKQTKGIVYTPDFLAGLVVEEMMTLKPLERGSRVVDPACGSGVFLVTAYRSLITLETETNGALPSPDRMKEILYESIFGIEREEEACLVTELSLILTLLDHISSEQLCTMARFKLPDLRDRCIFGGDFFDRGNGLWSSGQKFDWVIGNPPWTDLKKRSPDEEVPFRNWMKAHLDVYPVGDTRIAEGFTWLVGELLDEGGISGLIMPAKTLTNHKSREFRASFFGRHQLCTVMNLANLRRVLFSGAIAPAAVMIYSRELAEVDACFTHYGPFRANQIQASHELRSLWSMTVDANETQAIPHNCIETGSAVIWKAALWGHCETHLRQLEKIEALFPCRLETLCAEEGWSIPSEGLQLRDKPVGKKLRVPEIEVGDALRLAERAAGSRVMFFDASSLEKIPRRERWIRRGRVDRQACTIAIHPSWTFQVFSTDQFLVRPRQISFGGPRESEAHLRALTLYLNTSLVRYYLFFSAPEWGIERDRITLHNVRNIPVPRMEGEQITALDAAHRDLVERERSFDTPSHEIRAEIDRVVSEVLSFPERLHDAAVEFFEVDFTLNDGRVNALASEPISDQRLRAYGEELVAELDAFVLDAIAHRVILHKSSSTTLCEVLFEETRPEESVTVSREPCSLPLPVEHRQWCYIQRNLKLFESGKVSILKPSRMIDWTRASARRDAGDIIAEMLEHAGQAHG